MQIIDNFLDKEDFEVIQYILMSHEVDWHFSTITSEKRHSDEFQFCHIFYRDGEPEKKYSLIAPLINKIGPFCVVSAKANLLTKTNEIREYGFHVDINKKNLTTAVFYINTCNGFTLFRDGTKVESIANRLVMFDAQLEHTGASCTDEPTRVVINLNYFK
jgi:hypothetical protein